MVNLESSYSSYIIWQIEKKMTNPFQMNGPCMNKFARLKWSKGTFRPFKCTTLKGKKRKKKFIIRELKWRLILKDLHKKTPSVCLDVLFRKIPKIKSVNTESHLSSLWQLIHCMSHLKNHEIINDYFFFIKVQQKLHLHPMAVAT